MCTLAVGTASCATLAAKGWQWRQASRCLVAVRDIALSGSRSGGSLQRAMGAMVVGRCTPLSTYSSHLRAACCMPCPIVLFFTLAHCLLHQPIHSPLYLCVVTPSHHIDVIAAEQATPSGTVCGFYTWPLHILTLLDVFNRCRYCPTWTPPWCLHCWTVWEPAARL